jgi:hypothetical protein
MIARWTARRLAGVPVAPLLSLKLHQHQAVGAVLGQQDADSQPAVSDRADGMSKVTVHLYFGERSVQGQVQESGEERDSLEESLQDSFSTGWSTGWCVLGG